MLCTRPRWGGRIPGRRVASHGESVEYTLSLKKIVLEGVVSGGDEGNDDESGGG